MALTPDDPGADPAGYTVLAQGPETELIPGTNRTRAVMEVTIRTKRLGIVFTFRVPLATWRADGIAAFAPIYAAEVDQIGAHEHVTEVNYTQDVSPAGNIKDELQVWVGLDDGLQTADVIIPVAIMGTPQAFQLIEDTYARLAAVAASS